MFTIFKEDVHGSGHAVLHRHSKEEAEKLLLGFKERDPYGIYKLEENGKDGWIVDSYVAIPDWNPKGN